MQVGETLNEHRWIEQAKREIIERALMRMLKSYQQWLYLKVHKSAVRSPHNDRLTQRRSARVGSRASRD